MDVKLHLFDLSYLSYILLHLMIVRNWEKLMLTNIFSDGWKHEGKIWFQIKRDPRIENAFLSHFLFRPVRMSAQVCPVASPKI